MSSKVAIRRKTSVKKRSKRPKRKTARQMNGKKKSNRANAKKNVTHRWQHRRHRRQKIANLPTLAPTLF